MLGRSIRVVVLAFAFVALAAPLIRAQDGPPGQGKDVAPPQKETQKDKDVPGTPADAVILPEEELQRVRAELLRLDEERKRLAGASADLEQRARILERKSLGTTSPVLKPRHEVQPLTVREAVAHALQNNADLLVNALVADAAQEGIAVREADFDPTLTSSAQWQQTNSPNLSNNQFAGLPTGLSRFSRENWAFSTSLQKRFITGTELKVDYEDGHSFNNNAFAVNPNYAPRLRGTVTQNLLKGFWGNPLDVNQAQIRAAEDDAAAADAQYVQQLMEAALQVEQAYWDVVRAEETLKVSESSLRSATELLNDRKKRRDLGAGTGLEVTIAEAGVAQRRESMIVAENDLESKRDVLVRLSEPVDRKNRYDLWIVPVERPDVTESTADDLEPALGMAMAKRPDYRRAQLQVDAARQQLIAAENNALPQLDFFAFVQEDGIGQSSRSSWSNLGSGRFYSAGGGIKLALPLFLRSERAQARRARIDLDRADASVRALESAIVLEVRQAVRNIRTARARIDATHTARILAEKQLAAVKAEVRFGVSLPRQVLDSQTDLDSARNREIQALIDYRVALTALEKAKGTILDPYADKLPTRARAFLAR